MAKVVSRRSKKQAPRRNVNWVMIGGILAVGVIALFALLFTTLQGQGVPTPTPEANTVLNDFCAANEDNCIEKGSADAPVTVIELSDYACSHCRNFNAGGTAEALDEMYVQSGQVRWIVVPFSTNTTTRAAAEASFCAAEQDLFYEYHRAMFDQFGSESAYTDEGIVSAATTAGVDVEEFQACLSSGAPATMLQRNLASASNAGVRVTPTFFIDGKLVEGNLPLGGFQQEIDQAIES